MTETQPLRTVNTPVNLYNDVQFYENGLLATPICKLQEVDEWRNGNGTGRIWAKATAGCYQRKFSERSRSILSVRKTRKPITANRPVADGDWLSTDQFAVFCLLALRRKLQPFVPPLRRTAARNAFSPTLTILTIGGGIGKATPRQTCIYVHDPRNDRESMPEPAVMVVPSIVVGGLVEANRPFFLKC
jgi:hypothetical protein